MKTDERKEYELLNIKNGNIIPEAASEELQQSLWRQKKRLAKHGLQRELQDKELKPLSFIGGELLDTDGKYIPFCFERKLKRTTKYWRNNDEAATFIDDICEHYYAMKEVDESAKITSVDVIYEKMSYERSKEYIGRKSFGFMDIGIAVLGILMIFLWMICWTSALFIFILLMGQGSSVWSSITIGICIVSFKGSIRLTRYYETRWKLHQRRMRSRSVLESICRQMPEFCMEKIVAFVDSCINQIIYSEGYEEIGSFLECDISNFLQIHENVVHMERTNFWLKKFEQDSEYLYLDVMLSMVMEEYVENSIIREVKDIRIHLMKPIGGIMSEEDFYQDWYVTGVEVVKEPEYE